MRRVAVIGAGPAGTIASILLARGGAQVTLIEQHRFPRDKVCGECLSAVGITVLSRLGLHDAIAKLRPIILRRAIAFTTDGGFAEFTLSDPMWGISRAALDHALLELAQSTGVTLLLPARCEQITPEVRVRMLDSNQMKTIEADQVVVADGKAALMPHQPAATGDFGFKAHFSGVRAERDAIALFGVHGHYGGIAPIEGGLWNFAFSVPATRVSAHTRDFDSLFAGIVAENTALAGRMRHAQRVGDWLVSPLPRFNVGRRWPRRVIPVGNAAAALEPIGGEGMGLSMRSAELAARAILSSIQSGCEVDVARLRRDYRTLWCVRSLACRLGAKIVSSPALARLAIGIAARRHGPGALALRLVGK